MTAPTLARPDLRTLHRCAFVHGLTEAPRGALPATAAGPNRIHDDRAPPMPMHRLPAAAVSRCISRSALVAGAVIALQIGLMRVFAVGSWAHFGSLVVSLAMLGFGLASVIMCIANDWFERHWRAVAGGVAARCSGR